MNIAGIMHALTYSNSKRFMSITYALTKENLKILL